MLHSIDIVHDVSHHLGDIARLRDALHHPLGS